MNEENIEQISRSTSAISEWSVNLLSNMGIADNWVKYINMMLLAVALVVLVFIVQFITRKILQVVLNRSAKITGMPILYHLAQRRFPHFLAMIIPFSIV